MLRLPVRLLTHRAALKVTKIRPTSLQSARNMSGLSIDKGLIAGKWVGARSSATFEIRNPATGAVVGSAPDMAVEDTQAAIDAAFETFHSDEWQRLSAKERSQLLKNWFNLLEQNKQELAEIMTAESGKPLSESLGEIAYGNSFVEWFAEEARRIYGEVVPAPVSGRQILLTRQPIGVAGLITPWNFPHAMITRKAGAAVAAGCTVVIRPAEDTPLTALALAKLATDAGFPKGVINVVTSSRKHASDIGKLLCTSPKVAGISFTGSTEVGKLLYRQCADGIKKIGLELGGNAPFIVFDSANLDKAVAGAMGSKFRNCGQTCIASNRFLVQEGVFEKFREKIVAAVKDLKIGDGAKSGVQIGPLINEAQLKKVSEIVEDARAKGAQVIVGGRQRPDLGPLFYEPTVVSGVSPEMRLFSEEIFGPVLPLIAFKTEQEALKIANGTQRGLAGYFYSENLGQVHRVGQKLEVGMVGINEGLISCTEAAFGGVKESGIGREGSKHGIDDYVHIKYLCLGNLN